MPPDTLQFDVFPLRLTDFELYHIIDDSPKYPGVFPFEIRFRGQLNRDALAAAWRAALQRHPMLSTRLSGQIPNAYWIAGKSPELRWCVADESSCHESPAFDLRCEPPLRAHVSAGVEQFSLKMLFHHACCDGVGALRFVEDLLLAYDQNVTQPSSGPHWPPLNIERLHVRGEFGLRGYRPKLVDFYNVAVVWFRLMFRRLVVVQPRNGMAAVDPNVRYSPWAFSEAWLTRQQCNGLRQLAQRSGVTLNDLMIRALYLTIADWNGKVSRRWMRITIPTNLRLEEDAAMPATNVLGFAFLERRVGRDHDSQGLLQSIHEQMIAVKRGRLGLLFVAGLGIMCRFPRLMRWVLSRDLTFTTAVLSNLGTPLSGSPLACHDQQIVSGGATVEAIVCVPPLRRNTHVSIATMTHAGQLIVVLLADPTRFDQMQRVSFLEMYVSRLIKID